MESNVKNETLMFLSSSSSLLALTRLKITKLLLTKTHEVLHVPVFPITLNGPIYRVNMVFLDSNFCEHY